MSILPAPIRRALHATLLMIGLAVILSACGSDDSGAEESPPPADAESTQTESDPATSEEPATEQAASEEPAADEPPEEDDTAAEEAEPAEEPEPEPEPVELPPLFEGQRVVVVGSFDVWPNVGTLFEVGVVPATIIRAEGSNPPPDYFVEAYGDQLDQVEADLFAGLNLEVITAQNADVLILQKSWESFIDDQTLELFGGEDNLLFLENLDWRAALTQVAELAGVDPAELLAPYETDYRARLDQILAAIDHDPADVTASTFSWTAEAIETGNNTPIVRALTDLGYQLNETVTAAEFTTISFEQVLELDADVVFIQDNTDTGLDAIAQDPVWALSQAVQTDNVFERFQYGTQGAWIETMTLLDDLEIYLTQYDANS